MKSILKEVTYVMNMLINLNISQYICILNLQIVYSKYMWFYLSVISQ